jgi:hypothetical protein
VARPEALTRAGLLDALRPRLVLDLPRPYEAERASAGSGCARDRDPRLTLALAGQVAEVLRGGFASSSW